MIQNLLKSRLERGEATFGTWVTINSGDMVEIIADAGFDFLIFDMEHSPLTSESVQGLLQIMKNSSTTPLARIAWNDQVLIKLALDIGAKGLVIPLIKNQEDVRYATQASKYPPWGTRGIGPRRASDYYRRFAEYFKDANQQLLTILQIEHVDALENLDKIIVEAKSSKGVDAFFVGPADLSASMGIFAQYDHPDFIRALQKILKMSNDAKIPVGIHAFTVDDAIKRAEEGFKLIAVSSDVALVSQVFVQTATGVKTNGGNREKQ